MNKIITDQLIAIMDGEANIETEIDQKLYPKPDWSTHQIVRASGLVEDISKSGCGHPNRAWLAIHDPDGSLGFGVHCCDGECIGDDGKHLRKMIEIFKRERKL